MKLKSKAALGMLALVSCMLISLPEASACHTPLHDAVEQGKVEEVAALCEEHPEWLSEEDGAYGTPLMHSETEEMITCLAEHGAGFDNLKLSFVIVSGRIELAKYMIEHGADLDLGLFVAASINNMDLVKYAVEQKGADVNKAFVAAVCTGNVDLIQYFIDNGADINLKDGNGDTLLRGLLNWRENCESHFEFLNSCESLDVGVDYLREQGAEIDVENNDGGMPLNDDSCGSDPSVVDYGESKDVGVDCLCEQGADE